MCERAQRAPMRARAFSLASCASRHRTLLTSTVRSSQVISERAPRLSRRRKVHWHRAGREERNGSDFTVRCWAGHRGMPNRQQKEPGRAACERCVTREGHARARMVSCMHCADVTKASAASESAVPPNSNLPKLFCVDVPTAVSGDFACSFDHLIAWESTERSQYTN